MDMNEFKAWLDGYAEAKGGNLSQFDINVIKDKLDEVYLIVPQIQPFQPFWPNIYPITYPPVGPIVYPTCLTSEVKTSSNEFGNQLKTVIEKLV